MKIRNMKFTKLKNISVIALGLISSSAFAQDKSTIENTSPFGDISQYRTWSIGINGGILNQSNILGFNQGGFEKLEHNFGYSFYVKNQISPSFGAKLQYLGGKVGGINENPNSNEVSQYETQAPWSAALSAEWLLGNTNWRFFNGIVKPYVSIGVGALNFKTKTKTDADGDFITQDAKTKIYVPADVGFKFAVTKGIHIDLGYQLNWVNQDFDGVRADQYKNDLFSYAHAGLEFSLGNPEKPALNNSNPVATLVNTMNMQYDELKKDRDELRAANESLKEELIGLYEDLADDDGDGVPNKYDKCPNTPQGTKVDGSGCPLPEMKHETKVIERVVTKEDKKIVDEAINNLEFDLGKATIRPTSHASLNKVAALLIEKNFSLKLAGHTDNTGSMQVNLKLSKDRAEAVKAYLVSKGANASRIEATGYGPNQPIADNSTAEGRQQNRRVEFSLF